MSCSTSGAIPVEKEMFESHSPNHWIPVRFAKAFWQYWLSIVGYRLFDDFIRLVHAFFSFLFLARARLTRSSARPGSIFANSASLTTMAFSGVVEPSIQY